MKEKLHLIFLGDGALSFIKIAGREVDMGKGTDMGKDKLEPVQGKDPVKLQPPQLSQSPFPPQIQDSSHLRDNPSCLRDSNFLPGSNLFRVPMWRVRVHCPSWHALRLRVWVCTY
jgi:hypothetical protein